MFHAFCSEEKGSCFSLKKTFKIIGMVIAGLVFAGVMALIFSVLVKELWNWLMPSIFGLGLITFWQAFGLIILAKILFGGFGHHGQPKNASHGSHFKCNEDNYSRHYNKFWQSEGKSAFEKYVNDLKNDDKKDGA